jgi:hypothetical protein
MKCFLGKWSIFLTDYLSFDRMKCNFVPLFGHFVSFKLI